MAAPGFFGTDGRSTFDGGAAELQDRRTSATCTRRSACSACRTARSSRPRRRSWAIRSAASASSTTAAIETIFRFISVTTDNAGFNQLRPPRRLPARTRRRAAAAAGRGFRARLRQQPGAHRRPADDARRSDNAGHGRPRINLLIARARAPASATWWPRAGATTTRPGYLYDAARVCSSATGARRPDLRRRLRLARPAKRGELTYTCTPPGSGVAHRHRSRRGRPPRRRRRRRQEQPGKRDRHPPREPGADATASGFRFAALSSSRVHTAQGSLAIRSRGSWRAAGDPLRVRTSPCFSRTFAAAVALWN